MFWPLPSSVISSAVKICCAEAFLYNFSYSVQVQWVRVHALQCGLWRWRNEPSSPTGGQASVQTDFPFIQRCRSVMFIPDPNFSIPVSGSRVKRAPGPQQGTSIFNPKIVPKLLEIWSGKFWYFRFRITDPGLRIVSQRNPEVKKHRDSRCGSW